MNVGESQKASYLTILPHIVEVHGAHNREYSG